MCDKYNDTDSNILIKNNIISSIGSTIFIKHNGNIIKDTKGINIILFNIFNKLIIN